METKLSGIYPVVVTPFLEDGGIDIECLKWMINYLTEKKVHGVVILGSSSEAPYLTFEEKKQVIDVVSSELKNKKLASLSSQLTEKENLTNKLKLIVGVITTSTREAILLGNYAKEKNADALLIALTMYYHVRYEDVHRHYQLISKHVNVPILYYNFPSVTKLNLSPFEIAKLFEIENVVGMKDSMINIKLMRRTLSLIQKPISFFSGSSLVLYKTLQIGGVGCICPIPLLIPEVVTSLYSTFVSGYYKKAKILQDKVFDTLPVVTGKKLTSTFSKKLVNIALDLGATLKGDFQIALFKEALRLSGFPIKPIVRPPLQQLTEKHKKIVGEYFSKKNE